MDSHAGRSRIPRARVVLETSLPSFEGQVKVGRRTIPFQKNEKGGSEAIFFLPVVAGTPSEFKLRFLSNGKQVDRATHLEKVEGSRVFDTVGASCSPYLVEVARENGKNTATSSATVECRLIRSDSKEGSVPSLDLFLAWEGSGHSVKVNGVTTDSEVPSYFNLRLPAHLGNADGPLVLENERGERINLRYHLPNRWPRGFVGVGMGPYRYRLLAPGEDVSTTTAMLTLYGSYQVSESVRFTAFSATAIHKNFFSDSGFYLKTNSVKLIDERIAVSLMLGANLMGFKFNGNSHFKWGAPQGLEATYRDAFQKNYAMTVGAFVYPAINGKSYYNTWLRYGTGSFFGEVNFISVRDRFDGADVYSRSAGVSIGFPLVRLF